LTVREWYAQNADMLANIDLRRFVTFGVIKGFLYRVHRYAIRTRKGKAGVENDGNGVKRKSKRRGSDDGEDKDINSELLPFLDGTHCFDEICTELEISERELTERLKSRELGEVIIICR
jgi:nitrogen permease regulator 2-like protein